MGERSEPRDGRACEPRSVEISKTKPRILAEWPRKRSVVPSLPWCAKSRARVFSESRLGGAAKTSHARVVKRTDRRTRKHSMENSCSQEGQGRKRASQRWTERRQVAPSTPTKRRKKGSLLDENTAKRAVLEKEQGQCETAGNLPNPKAKTREKSDDEKSAEVTSPPLKTFEVCPI